MVICRFSPTGRALWKGQLWGIQAAFVGVCVFCSCYCLCSGSSRNPVKIRLPVNAGEADSFGLETEPKLSLEHSSIGALVVKAAERGGPSKSQ